MKKFAVALLLTFGFFGANAAFADDWFHHYDHDHDGRWNRHEFYDAQRHWALTHHGYPVNAWGAHFNRYDYDHNRYWDRHEAWRYHHW